MTHIDLAVRPSGATVSTLSLLCVSLAIWLGVAPATAQESEVQSGDHLHKHASHQEPSEQERLGDAPSHDSRDHAPTAQPQVPVKAQSDDGLPGQAAAPDHADDDRDDREGNGHAHGQEAPAEVRLTPKQVQTLGLVTAPLELRRLGESLRAPGEVRLNSYATAQVTPRIEAQVTGRHARLGDRVQVGQPLVTLSSVEMAVAQGDLVVAEREWQRLTKLGDQFVSDSNYLEASVARQKARSRAFAFGMTPNQIDGILQSAFETADGTFELLAPQAGTLVRDAFVLGELVEPGRVLFEITDESVRWVEARMPPEEVALVSVDDPARVRYRDAWLEGRVTQIHHLLDETTRTQAVRIEVPDPGHRLHPGVFVDASIMVGEGDPVLAVPESAVLRGPDGDWLVFVAVDEEGAYAPAEVDVLRTSGGLTVIEGLPPETRVVTQGAFFLQSELAKGGFDPHNH